MLFGEEHTDASILVLTPCDEMFTADMVHEFSAGIESGPMRHVIIDCTSLRFLVSNSLYPHAAPLGPLLQLKEKLRHQNRRLALCCLSKNIAEVLRITRIDQFIETFPDLETALSTLRGGEAS